MQLDNNGKVNFDLISKFEGYTSRYDQTKLPPGYLVTGSQNVMIDVTGNVKTRPGYTLDGAANLTPYAGSGAYQSGIISAYDWEEHKGNVLNLRHWGQKIQFRYVNSSGSVSWIDLKAGSVSPVYEYTPIRFVNYWDNAQKENVLLFTFGTDAEHAAPYSTIFEWNGAVATTASYSSVGSSALGVFGTSSLSSLTIAGGTSDFTLSSSGSGVALVGTITCNTNPTDGLTLNFVINGTTVTVTFVTTIGTNPGNVLIESTKAGTLANLLGFLQSPSTTTAKHVAVAAPSQVLIGYLYYSAPSTYNIINSGSYWGILGFYVAGVGRNGASRSVVINGNAYKYEGYSGNTLFGLTSDPSAEAVGSLAVQKLVAYSAVSEITNIPAGFNIDLIANINNQIYYGSTNSTQVYISKINNFLDVSYSSPSLVGDGGLLTLRSTPTAFVVQENTLYISGKNSSWYTLSQTISSDNINVIYEVKPIKSGALQAAVSQECVTKDKNDIVLITFEPVLSTLGRIANQLATPMTQDLSYSIVNDFTDYNFTGAFLKYFKNFIYIALPKEGKVLIYNQTNPNNPFWEAPQIMPFSCFSVIDGELYGHDSYYPQSYKMFSGLTDNRVSTFAALSQSSLSWYGMAASPNGNVYASVPSGDIYMRTAETGNFVALSQGNKAWQGMTATLAGNVYACVYGGDIYMQTAGSGNFVALSQGNKNWVAMAASSNGDVYAAVDGGDIYKQTAGAGNFVALSQTSRAWRGMTATLNGNVYASVGSGDIYMQTGGTGNFVALSQTTRLWVGMASTPVGDVYASVQSGDIYKQTAGTGNFVATGQASLAWRGITSTVTGNLYACVNGGDIYKLSAVNTTSVANFSYMNMGIRELTKWFNEFYTEGRIYRSTSIIISLNYETDGDKNTVSFTFDGDDSLVANYPLASFLVKFRVIKTSPRVEFYEFQPSFSSYGSGMWWELIAFGPLSTITNFGNNKIKQ